MLRCELNKYKGISNFKNMLHIFKGSLHSLNLRINFHNQTRFLKRIAVAVLVEIKGRIRQ